MAQDLATWAEQRGQNPTLPRRRCGFKMTACATAARVAPGASDDVPGRIVVEGGEPALATVEGRLVLESVTPQGRRPMHGDDWLRGRRVGPAAR